MNIPVSYKNPYVYKFNNNIGSLNNNLENEIDLDYISFYKIRDNRTVDTLHLQINQSVARNYW